MLCGKQGIGQDGLSSCLERLNPASDKRGKFDPVTEYPKTNYTKYKQQHEANPAAVIEAEFELDGEEIARIEAAFGKGALESRNLVVKDNYKNIWGCEFKVKEQAGVAFVLENSELGDELVKRLTNARTILELIERLNALPDKPRVITKCESV